MKDYWGDIFGWLLILGFTAANIFALLIFWRILTGR